MRDLTAYYNELIETHGKSVSDAVRKLNTLFDENVYKWLAGLWDGEAGGFYYSNSARDNEGFYPDMESTAQAIGNLGVTGIISEKTPVPLAMQRKMVEFMKAKQDPDDGYFYHAQWGKDVNTSRRARDLGHAIGIITSYGDKPLYPTAIERIEAATKEGSVKAENSTVPEHLRSKEAFCKYLDELNINKGSYAKGHRLSSQAAQISAAGLAEVCIEYLASKQNKENGTWEEEVNINSINGVTKIGTAITSLGGRIPNATLAFKSAISVALVTDKGGAVTAPYNPLWTIMQMMNGFRDGNMTEEYEQCRKQLFDNGVGLMRAAYEKLSKYYYEPEGAFHYNWYDGASTSQGVPVSLGLHEGDVNATSMAIDTIFRIFDLLELEVGKPFDKEDGKKFIKAINE